MNTLGDLERSVMDVLWEADAPMAATDLRDALVRSFAPQGREPALTTVMTVLSRLEAKGFVLRDRAVRPHRYRAATSREEHIAELMHDVLGSAVDRDAVLARFVGAASDADTSRLRRLLDED